MSEPGERHLIMLLSTENKTLEQMKQEARQALQRFEDAAAGK